MLLVLTMLLTVFVDLTVAIGCGVAVGLIMCRFRRGAAGGDWHPPDR